MSSLREVYTRKQRITEDVSIIKNVSSFRPHIEFISYFCVHILLSVSYTHLTLDFGGFAKGYALKKIQEILLRGNIENAFVDFGNSSIMGIGHHPYGDCWKVSLQNPYTQQTLDEFCLTDNTLSTSGNTEQYTGHIINPLTGIYNEQKKVTSILSDNPLDAEILSTVWKMCIRDRLIPCFIYLVFFAIKGHKINSWR